MSEFAGEAADIAPADPVDWAAEIVEAHTGSESADVGQPEAPAWTGPSQSDWETTQEALSSIWDLVETAGAQTQQEQAAAQYQADIDAYIGDPWSEGYEERAAYVQNMQAINALDQYVAERTAPLEQFVYEQQYRAADAEADQVLDREFARVGMSLNDEGRGELREFAATVYPEFVQLKMQQGVPPEVAHSRETALELLKGLADHYAPMIERAINPPRDLMDVVRRHTGTMLPPSRATPGLAPAAAYALKKVFG